MLKFNTKKWIRIQIVFSIFFCLFSCNPISYSNGIRYTNLSEYNCDNKATNILLFFEGENTNFTYKKIGLIEINSTNNEQMTFDLMKQKCYEMCGNTIINIAKQTIPQDFTDKNDKVKTYNKVVYSGIAVYSDSNFEANSENEIDTAFLTRNRLQDQKLNNPSSRFLGGLVGVFAAFIYIILELPEE